MLFETKNRRKVRRLTDQIITAARSPLREASCRPTLPHCSAANFNIYCSPYYKDTFLAWHRWPIDEMTYITSDGIVILFGFCFFAEEIEK